MSETQIAQLLQTCYVFGTLCNTVVSDALGTMRNASMVTAGTGRARDVTMECRGPIC